MFSELQRETEVEREREWTRRGNGKLKKQAADKLTLCRVRNLIQVARRQAHSHNIARARTGTACISWQLREHSMPTAFDAASQPVSCPS